MDYRIWRQSDIFLKRAAGSPALRILVGLGRKVEFGRGVAGEGAGRTHAVCATLRQGRGGGATIRASARPAHAARPGVHGHHQPVLRGCRNHQEAEKDAADRASIVAALERQLVKGDKALVGNKGFRRYLKTISEEHFAIDPDKIEEEKKFDGIFVLRTNTDLNPLEAMLCYKQLWTIGVSSEGHAVMSVKVRPEPKDSGSEAREALWRESKTAEPSDNILERSMREASGCNVQ